MQKFRVTTKVMVTVTVPLDVNLEVVSHGLEDVNTVIRDWMMMQSVLRDRFYNQENCSNAEYCDWDEEAFERSLLDGQVTEILDVFHPAVGSRILSENISNGELKSIVAEAAGQGDIRELKVVEIESEDKLEDVQR